MNTKLLIWILIIIFGIGILSSLWYATATPTIAPQQTGNQSTSTLPASGSTNSILPSSSFPSHTNSGITILDRTGTAISVRDFLKNGTTIADTANAGRYLLAGSLGYCPPGVSTCQAALSTDFIVYYNNGPQSFTIALTEEPIGHARLDAEQFLMTTLGITQSQMCTLNYLVSVTRYVNATYTGKNLGFSFCPGATVLPN